MQLRGQNPLFPERIPDIKIPPMPRRKLSMKFTPQIKREIACIKSKIMEIEDDNIKDFFMLALSSTIRTVVESKSKDIDVLNIFMQDVKMMVNRMEEFYKICHKEVLPAHVYCSDFREAYFLKDDSVDLIVTSPTYVNAYDYHREHMFNIFWLHDYLYKKFHMDFETFKRNELGSHSHYIYNRFKTVAEYFDGLYKCFQQMSRILKTGKVCCVVVGDSTVEGEYINTHQYFKEIGMEVGLEIKVDILRNIDVESKYLSKTIGKINQEHVLIFEKVNEDWEKADPKEYTRRLLSRLLKTCKPKNKNKLLEALRDYK
jgi:site-specific DNA-methyltransferase (cytosine-N4-specific)